MENETYVTYWQVEHWDGIIGGWMDDGECKSLEEATKRVAELKAAYPQDDRRFRILHTEVWEEK